MFLQHLLNELYDPDFHLYLYQKLIPAPDVLPVSLTPFECKTVSNGLIVSLKVKTVNVRTSNI